MIPFREPSAGKCSCWFNRWNRISWFETDPQQDLQGFGLLEMMRKCTAPPVARGSKTTAMSSSR